MEDSINVLIFIATIVIFIVSAIYKNKKGPAEGKQDFTQSIETLFGINPIVTNEKIIQTANTKQVIDSEYKSVTNPSENKPVVPVFKEEKKDNYAIEIEEEQPYFDLKAAIIYAEIVNRKEY